jgi:hypothetical protein
MEGGRGGHEEITQGPAYLRLEEKEEMVDGRDTHSRHTHTGGPGNDTGMKDDE